MKLRTDKPDYLYIMEVGVYVRIRGVMSGFCVMLTNGFDTFKEAETYLLENGWSKSSDFISGHQKWYKTT